MGAVLDHGSPRVVFVAIAACLIIAIGTVVRVRYGRNVRTVSPAAAD